MVRYRMTLWDVFGIIPLSAKLHVKDSNGVIRSYETGTALDYVKEHRGSLVESLAVKRCDGEIESVAVILT